MSRASEAGNAVVYAAEQVCGLYGVQVTREQSRMFNVQGTAGRWRPMFFGQWTDNFGKIHRAGKADLLARPRIEVAVAELAGIPARHPMHVYRSAPLWIECKSGAGRMTSDQIAFKNWVDSNGDYFLLLHDDVRPLITWFDAHGVERRCDSGDLRAVTDHVDSTELYLLPCKHCGALRSEHIGPALGCRLRKGQSAGGWRPDLKARV